MLIVFALLLAAADRLGRRQRPLSQLTWGHGLLFGLAQAMALTPGVSRSGGTITAGLMMGYTRQAAPRFSFLLAIPVAPGPTALATLIAFGVGYVVIIAFLKLVTTRSCMPFAVYRIALGVRVLVLMQVGALSAR